MRQTIRENAEAPAGALEESIATYDADPERFADQYEAIDVRRYVDWMCEHLPVGSAIVDVGSGSGRDTATFQALGYETIGVEISEGMLDIARKLHPEALFRHGDARALPLNDDSMDGVWAMASLVHLGSTDVRRALCEFGRVLKPGGFVFVSLPTAAGASWRTEHGQRRWFPYLKAEIVRALMEQAEFVIDGFEEAEGIHSGSWINVLAHHKDPAP